MRQIEPIQYTTDGNEATQLEVNIVQDNLIDSCYLEWKLYDINNQLVNNGMIFCGNYTYNIDNSTSTDYTDVKNDPYNFAANNLSKPLTFVNL